MAQRPKHRRSNPFSTVNPHAAGIDIGATQHVVAVAASRDPTPVRTFRTFSGDWHALADWLRAVGITVRVSQRLPAGSYTSFVPTVRPPATFPPIT